MRLADAERIVVTTYDTAGQGTTSSEFVVSLGEDTVALWTPHSAPWVQRLAVSPVVSVQAGNKAGRPLREEPVFEGRAELRSEGADLDTVEAATKAKYGFAASLVNAVDKAWELGGKRTPHGAVVIHLVG